MAGLFDALGTATRGLQTTQSGLATTGHNIANADTEGYSRQRAILQAGQPQPSATGTIGSGVEQLTVQRIVDRFVGFRLITETSRKAALETQSTIYREVETLVNDQLAGGLTDELSGFFDSLDGLSAAAEPDQLVARGQVVASGQSLVDTVHRYDTQLRNLQRDADRGITGLIPQINELTSQIADLNGKILAAETISPANDLRDRQEVLIRELAEKLDITATVDGDGMSSIRITNGLTLVDRRRASEFIAVVDPASPNSFDPTFSQVYYGGAGSFFDATSLIRGGELGALIEARDSIVGGTIRELDAFVATLSDQFNQVHRQGVGLDDGNSHDFFADLTGQPSVDDSARNFSLSADIDPDQGGTLNHIAAGERANPAAPSPTDPPGLAADTRWADELKALRSLRVQNYLAGDAQGAPTGQTISISGGLINMIGEIGQNARTTGRQLEQQEAVLSAVEARRDGISGVSVDEEVAELVKLQANFQANARVISTVTALMQDLYDAL